MTLCIFIFLGFGVEAYVSGLNLLCLILLLFLYGFAIIPLMYPINYFFKTPSTGFVLVSCINIFIGLITTIATITLETFEEEPDLKNVNTILIKVFLIFPHYCLGRGLFDMSKTHASNALKSRYSQFLSFCFELIDELLFCFSSRLHQGFAVSIRCCRTKSFVTFSPRSHFLSLRYSRSISIFYSGSVRSLKQKQNISLKIFVIRLDVVFEKLKIQIRSTRTMTSLQNDNEFIRIEEI